MISETLMGQSDFQSRQLLTFVSEPRLYGIQEGAKPFVLENETVKISETWEKPTGGLLMEGIGEYRIKIEAPVNNLQEVQEAFGEITEIVGKLERLWPFVCGEPLKPMTTVLTFDTQRPGWTSNNKE